VTLNADFNKQRGRKLDMLALGCDHGGFAIKEEIKIRLKKAGYEVKDFGCYTNSPVDYPDKALEVAHAVVNGECEKGILFCGTGIGVSIAANKVKKIRAALCADTYSARMAKEHNNANIITLGGRTTGVEVAWDIIQAYLGAEFLGGVHLARVEKIDLI
jgi:ribose 5-phosphate isomerase B